LEGSLRERGIGYIHVKAAGNPFRPRNGLQLTAQECFSLYERHLTECSDVIDDVLEVVEHVRSAILCYERLATECHRAVLLEALSTVGAELRVVHL
jgi:uncharacterized protein (DUF488 family)